MSLKSRPGTWEYPLATSLALYLSGSTSVAGLILNTHLQEMIDLAKSKDKQFDPMVWIINVTKNVFI